MLDVIEFPEVISKAVVDHLQFYFGFGSADSIAMTSVCEGFCWIRVTPQQLGLFMSDKETEVATVIVLFPQTGAVRVEIRADVRLRLTHPGAANGGMSVVEVRGELTPLLTCLPEPCNAMDSLRLLVDSDDEHNEFILVHFNASAHLAKGWVTMQEASRWATEAAERPSGDPPGFRIPLGHTIS
jgi:hypothetical protein